MDASLEKDAFGTTSQGTPVERYTLRNPGGMVVRLMTYGAAVTELWVPDRRGRADDIVLGFDELAPYEDPAKNPFFGATIGRVAFRITEGKFTLDGRAYQLTLNIPPHHLHGGTRGLSRVVWKAEPLHAADPAVRLSYASPDGDQGYPGNLQVAVVYTLTAASELKIEYTATTDRPTPVNLTHHGYFNLAGAGSGTVLGHVLQLAAERYTPLDDKRIPTGEVATVEGTPLDFRRPTPIGARLGASPEVANGYDLSYPLTERGQEPFPEEHVPVGQGSGPEKVPDTLSRSLRHAATLSEPTSGRVMEVWTTQPAIVLYTGNYLDGRVRGKRGSVYGKHAGVCLETAHLPDSVNQPKFPSIILRPGQTYRHTCVYRFSAR
jgi:aldose 1-epimerase